MERRRKTSLFRIILWIFKVIFGFPLHRRKATINPSSLGLNYEDTSFYTRKCKKRVLLRGWYILSKKSQKSVILVHGWGANRAQPEIDMLGIVKGLVNNGFNVLTFDLRAHGESGGNRVYFGRCEAYDVLGAYDFLVNEKKIPPKNIGLMGFSYGALISILAATKEKINGVVVDSGPGDTFQFIKKIMGRFYIPPIFYMAKWLAGAILKIDAKELDTKRAIENVFTPIFFIHGKKDNIPYSLVQELYQAKKRNSLDRIWITEAFHTESYKTFPEEYIKRITEFFNKTLGCS